MEANNIIDVGLKHIALEKAKKEKNDEFYTLYDDIDAEVSQYDGSCFEGKTIYCPCDSIESNFWRFFLDHFFDLGLTGLIASHHEDGATQVESKSPFFAFPKKYADKSLLPSAIGDTQAFFRFRDFS